MLNVVLADTETLRTGSRLVWLFIAAMAAMTAAFYLAMGLSVTWEVFPKVPAAIVICVALTLFYRFFRPDPAIFYATELMGQILLISVLGGLLTYGAAAVGLPYRDAQLLAADRWLGFDVKWYLSFVNSRPWLAQISLIAYVTMGWQAIIVFFVLLFTRRIERLQDFAMSMVVSMVITSVVFSLFPALGWDVYLHIDHAEFPNISFIMHYVPYLEAVRSGALRAIPVDAMHGIISFPSYHAAVAVIAVWALWPVRLFRWPLLILNALMIASTPIQGTHYLFDVIGGLAVCACTLLIVGYVRRTIHHHRAESAFGQSVAEHVAMAPD
jgi:membrane-associated phospholipid phosphatase